MILYPKVENNQANQGFVGGIKNENIITFKWKNDMKMVSVDEMFAAVESRVTEIIQ